MSLEMLAAVWNLELQGAEKDVMDVLAWHANAEGICWPSKMRIAYSKGLHPDTVQRALGRLKKAGLIEVLDFATGGRGRTPLYKLHPQKGCTKPPFNAWLERAKGGPQVVKGGPDVVKRGTSDPPEPTRNVTTEPSSRETPESPPQAAATAPPPATPSPPSEPDGPDATHEPDEQEKKATRKELEKQARNLIDDFNEIHPEYTLPVVTFIARVQAREKIQSMTAVRRWREFYAPVAEARVGYGDKAALYALAESNRRNARNIAYFHAVLKENPEGASTGEYVSPNRKTVEEGGTHGADREGTTEGNARSDDWFYN